MPLFLVFRLDFGVVPTVWYVCFLFHYTNIFNAFEHIFISFRDILKQIFITLGDICDNLKIFI
jgi:hypothetical protein